jgi:hypothetical protein
MESLEHGANHQPQYYGNPEFVDKAVEAPELEKAQMESELETALEEMNTARERVEQASKDEMIDPDAAQQFYQQSKKTYEDLQAEWDGRFGKETSH